MSVLRTVILAGELAKKFGRVHRFAISTPAEAIKALCANFRDFERDLMQSERRGVGYRVTVDKQPLGDIENLQNPFSKTFRIVPVIIGGKSAFLGVILGAAIIAGAFLTGGATLTASGVAFSGLAGQMAFGLGVSLVLGGVSQMLSPQPKATAYEAPENKPSYAFNGPVNTTAQGNCVPLAYGRLIIGSAVISAGITADDYGASGIA